jgi:hypothetical protein
MHAQALQIAVGGVSESPHRLETPAPGLAWPHRVIQSKPKSIHWRSFRVSSKMPVKRNIMEWIWNPLQNASIPEIPATVRNFLGNRREDISATVAGDNAACELLQNLHNSSQNGASWGLGIPYMSAAVGPTSPPAHMPTRSTACFRWSGLKWA